MTGIYTRLSPAQASGITGGPGTGSKAMRSTLRFPAQASGTTGGLDTRSKETWFTRRFPERAFGTIRSRGTGLMTIEPS